MVDKKCLIFRRKNMNDTHDHKIADAWRSALAEYFGTMFFVFIGAGSVVMSGVLSSGGGLDPSRLLVISFAHGLAIFVMVAAFGGISGGHFNPAVTIGAMAFRAISVRMGCVYIIMQLTGAIMGASFVKELLPTAMRFNVGAHAVASGITLWSAVNLEALLTSLLMFVILFTAMDQKRKNMWAPLAIGMTIMLDHLIGVPLTGASMNPARSFGPALVSGMWANHWVYWVGPIVGSIVAVLFYRIIFCEKTSRQ